MAPLPPRTVASSARPCWPWPGGGGCRHPTVVATLQLCLHDPLLCGWQCAASHTSSVSGRPCVPTAAATNGNNSPWSAFATIIAETQHQEQLGHVSPCCTLLRRGRRGDAARVRGGAPCAHEAPLHGVGTLASGCLSNPCGLLFASPIGASAQVGRRCGWPLTRASRSTANSASANRMPAAAHALGHAAVTAIVGHLQRLVCTSCSFRVGAGRSGATRCVQRRLSSGQYLHDGGYQ